MDESTYVGPTAAAKLVALVKAALNSKADKTNATTSVAGLMSAADKAKLDGIAAGATKITVDSEMSVSSANPVMNGTITARLADKADKTDLDRKLDKSGGTITGNLTVNGDFEPAKGLTTDGGINAQSVRTPVLTLHDNGVAGASASINVSGVGAVEVTVPDGDKRAKARLKIGTPTDSDTDAAANVEYVKAKISEVTASGGVDVDNALSATSTNPVQNKVVKTALDAKMDKSGGTFTGNLTGKYITGTWLQTTEATDLGRTPGKIAVLDDSGWVYYRTPAELLADLGADYIESQGTTGVWTWRKWASGIAEMWAVFEAESLAIDEAWGSLYFGTWMRSDINVSARNYPFSFVETPTVSATYMGGGSDAWLVSIFSASDNPLTRAPAYALARPNTATILAPRISYYVVGKYK